MAHRTLFFRNNKFIESSGVFLLMGLLALILLTLDRNTNAFENIRESVKSNMVQMFALVYNTNTELSQGFRMLADRSTLISQLNQIEKDKENITIRYNLEVPQLVEENTQLRNLLNLTDVFSEGIIVAEQIRSNNANTRSLLYLNVGENHMVRLSQPVLSSYGIVGQVQRIFPEYSEVLPITHPNHAFSVRVREKSTRYIARGTGNKLLISNISDNNDIQQGDEIISTGLGGIYPKLYPVGTVERVEKQQQGQLEVYITPNTDFVELRFVVIVYQRRFSLQIH